MTQHACSSNRRTNTRNQLHYTTETRQTARRTSLAGGCGGRLAADHSPHQGAVIPAQRLIDKRNERRTPPAEDNGRDGHAYMRGSHSPQQHAGDNAPFGSLNASSRTGQFAMGAVNREFGCATFSASAQQTNHHRVACRSDKHNIRDDRVVD